MQEIAPGTAHARAKRAIESGQVSVDGAVVTDPGAWIDAAAAVDWQRDRPRERSPRQLRVELLHADADVAVVVKPAGLLSVPTPEREKDTLLSRVALAVTRRLGSRPFLAVVHRLDRDTSGLCVFATSRRAQAALQGQLLRRSMTRVYEAVVAGRLAGEAGSFTQPLVGDGVHRRRWVARPGEAGKPAVTHWRVLERFARATHVEVALETGRTHQIRIHFAAAGHPVLGEAVYRVEGADPHPGAIARQALHAREIAFRHPADDRELRFEAPPPEDFARLLARLREGGHPR